MVKNNNEDTIESAVGIFLDFTNLDDVREYYKQHKHKAKSCREVVIKLPGCELEFTFDQFEEILKNGKE